MRLSLGPFLNTLPRIILRRRLGRLIYIQFTSCVYGGLNTLTKLHGGAFLQKQLPTNSLSSIQDVRQSPKYTLTCYIFRSILRHCSWSNTQLNGYFNLRKHREFYDKKINSANFWISFGCLQIVSACFCLTFNSRKLPTLLFLASSQNHFPEAPIYSPF